MKKLLLWDMDGTLADDRQRRHFYLSGDYASYFSYESQMADPVYEEARALYDEMKLEGWTMTYLTARLERNRPATVDWLHANGFESPETALLRPEADYVVRPPKFKSAMLHSLINSGEYERVVLVDNDPLVVERITEDHGAEHVFFASWDLNPEMSSIQNISTSEL